LVWCLPSQINVSNKNLEASGPIMAECLIRSAQEDVISLIWFARFDWKMITES
jgi:hypothetical protein